MELNQFELKSVLGVVVTVSDWPRQGLIQSVTGSQRVSQLARNLALVFLQFTVPLSGMSGLYSYTSIPSLFCLIELSVLSTPSVLSVLPCLSTGVPYVPQPVEYDQEQGRG